MTSETKIESRVIEVIRRELHVEGRGLYAPTRFVDDLGADSLAVAELTIAFEEAFDIEIADDEVNQIRTVRDAVAAVEMHLRARRPPRDPAITDIEGEQGS
jgi:acyl carrier protein